MEDCDDEVEEEDAVLVAMLLLSWLLKVLLHWSVGYVVEPELPLQSIVQARRRCYKKERRCWRSRSSEEGMRYGLSSCVEWE